MLPGQYRSSIDGLRAVAVLAVFVFHLDRRWLPGGFVGVDVFFVISGYLITSILLRDCQLNTFSFAKFYQRRVARLFPAFFTVAATTLAVAHYVYSDQDIASCGANLTAAALSLANLKLMSQGNYFTLSPDAQPLLHYWSLSVEEQFYMLFPAGFLLAYLKAKRFSMAVLAFSCAASLLACIWITHSKPTWAFFMLPTRAWELLAGGLVANYCAHRIPSGDKRLSGLLPLLGLMLIGISLFVIEEGTSFPGHLAMLPVLGAICVIGPYNVSTGLAEVVLSWRPVVLVGRMSYSLYLWHWPVFSFVDYKFYLTTSVVRVGLKVGLTFLATVLCFYYIESPGRVFLNHPRRRFQSFAFLTCALLIFVPLGTAVRRLNYIDAGMQGVANGGIVFHAADANASMVLMGDSYGSMYGKMAKEIASELGIRLNVISVAAGDPLPNSSGHHPSLWVDSVKVVKREKPTFLLLVCDWRSKLQNDQHRLNLAISELRQHARRIILITQPPELPTFADRESMRNGSRPPFKEDTASRIARINHNRMVRSFKGDNVTVIDIESLFTATDGSVIFADDHGNFLFHDRSHLSGFGAKRVKRYVLAALDESRLL